MGSTILMLSATAVWALITVRLAAAARSAQPSKVGGRAAPRRRYQRT
jgi:hypothetical protein